jgi:hypothetical protein
MATNDFTIDQAFLKARYIYEPDTGKFISRRLEREIGWIEQGYKYIEIKGKDYPVHRLIWMYLLDRWPETMIDHINNDKLDNRMINLREVNHSQNMQNRAIRESGYKGVFPYLKGRWRTAIGYKGKQINLGSYDTKEEAFEIYCKAAKVFHTHNPCANLVNESELVSKN